MGLAVKASSNDCNNALFSYFAKIETYHICCDGSNTYYNYPEKLETTANNFLNGSEEKDIIVEDELIVNTSDGTIVLPEDDGK